MFVRVNSLLCMCLICISCGNRHEASISESEDQWMEPFDPIEYADTLTVEYEIHSYRLVSENTLGYAIEKLGNSSIVEIPRPEAVKLLALDALVDSIAQDTNSFFLARSCSYTDDDVLRVYYDGTVLLHTIDSFTAAEREMRKRAIVLALPTNPSQYWYMCSSAK